MSSNSLVTPARPLDANRRGLSRVLWLLPAVFVVHDGEELLTMPGWVASHRRELDQLASLGGWAAEMVGSLPTSAAQFAVAVGVILLLLVTATAGASMTRRRGFWLYAYAAFLGVLFLHVFTHIAQAFLFGGYVPGLVGAVVAIIPAALYIYGRLFRAGLLTAKSAAATALLGLALFVPGVMLAHQVGRALGGR